MPDGYPRPRLRRPTWTSLDGQWEFSADPASNFERAETVPWTQRIVVPFAPETTASGVFSRGFLPRAWYRHVFGVPSRRSTDRVLLHFGAVDYAATVWLNGTHLGQHEGGYTPFSFDVTPHLVDGLQTLVVCADDDPHDLAKPRGKQDWQREPHAIWYPRTTGIWQTVWLEVVPATRISGVQWTSSVAHWSLRMQAAVEAGTRTRDDLRLRVRLSADDQLLADETHLVSAGEVDRGVQLPDPGIDDARNSLLWSPESPTLIRAELQLLDGAGEVVDVVQSYTAMRDVSVDRGRFLLNGRPYRLRMLLDQGYWPDTGLTPPGDAALRRDVELVKAMGFNGVRKHQKIEDPRFLYWADAMGLLVWEEMPSAYRFTPTAVQRVVREWTAVIDRDRSHPCVVAWVPLNESWGVPNLLARAEQREYVRALYHLTRTLDPSRPVAGNDGWEFVATDIVGIHDYDDDADRIARRYATEDQVTRLVQCERPAGRALALDGFSRTDQPVMLTEFGGMALAEQAAAGSAWGYTYGRTPTEFLERFQRLMSTVRALSPVAGFAYTQFTDTYQEVNGLLKMDRSPKVPLEAISQAVRGTPHTRDEQLQQLREERLRTRRRQPRAAPTETV